MDQIANIIEKKIKDFIQRDIVIKQEGFLESKYYIKALSYSIVNGILNIIDKKEDVYLKINLNQIYKVENEENYIKMFVDNDTIISLIK